MSDELLGLLIIGIMGFIGFVIYRRPANPADRHEEAIAALGFGTALRFDEPSGKTSLLIDPDRFQVAIAERGKALRILEPGDLLAVEVERDGTSIEKANRGNQLMGFAAGGLLLGPVGMLLGGLSGSKRRDERVRRLAMRIYTTALDQPVREIVFLDQRKGAKIDGVIARNATREIDEWYGRMLAVLDARQKEPAV